MIGYIDRRQIDEAGWGVILPTGLDASSHSALQPLLELRRQQAGALYREFTYDPSQSAVNFLQSQGAVAGYLEPRRVPYYLLIVGPPSLISFDFQIELGQTYAVGRLDFDHPEDFTAYAYSLTRAESYNTEPRAVLFGPSHPGDLNSPRIINDFLAPLAEYLPRQSSWEVSTLFGDQATKSSLTNIFSSTQSPGILITGGHGMVYPPGDDQQFHRQGSLVCQGWSGPGSGPVPESICFTPNDISPEANLFGTICLMYSAFSAGTDVSGTTPGLYDIFPEAKHFTDQPFTSALVKRMLSLPNGAALGVAGVVGPVWSYAHALEPAGVRQAILAEVLNRLSQGEPIGLALEPIRLRYAEMASNLDEMLTYASVKPIDDRELVVLWTTMQDARSLVLSGDPAARLNIATYENIYIRQTAQKSWSDQVLQKDAVPGTAFKPEDLLVEAVPGMAVLPGLLFEHLDPNKHPLYTVVVTNKHLEQYAWVKIQAQIEGVTELQEFVEEFDPLFMRKVHLLPRPLPNWRQLIDKDSRLSLNIRVASEDNASTLFEKSFSIRLIDPEIFPLAVRDASSGEWHDFSKYLGWYIAPPPLDLVSRLETHIRAQQGQSPDQPLADQIVAAVHQLVLTDLPVRRSARAISRRLSDNIPLTKVTTPEETMSMGQMDSLQAAILYSSLLETRQVEVGIALLPRSALIAWQTEPGPDQEWHFLDPAADTDLSFAENQFEAEKMAKKFSYGRTNPGEYPLFKLVTIRAMREANINPYSSAA